MSARLRRALLGALRDERGAGGALVLGVCGALVALTAGLLSAFGGFVAAQRASAAADASALAAADVASGLLPGDPCEEAGRVAAANGAELVDCTWMAEEATVTVRVVLGAFSVDDRARAGRPPLAEGGVAHPLSAPYAMTDGYGPRVAPVAGASSSHPAVDLVGRLGDPVFAIHAGRVESADGLTLTIVGPDGTRTSYLHMHPSDHLVAVGEEVLAGQQIGRVGNTGQSTGPHLDLRINVASSTRSELQDLPLDPGVAAAWPGTRFVNPEDWFRLHGLELCPADWCARAG